ncbi:MAG: hypothetical protein CSA34_02205 [Desulfobulbus propionicus]|nr:MAG: hypothetical protein CSA34_02205 [Desulfobulbus propionicus]
MNSYYLHLDKFVEHLQGEMGSGCLYLKGVTKELLVYFDEVEIVRTIVQEHRHQCETHPSLAPLQEALKTDNFTVKVFYLGANAIFFWGQLPQFQRAKASLNSEEIPLPDLIFRLKQKKFSGFIDVTLLKKKESCLVFFHEGRRVGGSYSWGKGGLSTSDEDYNWLLSKLQVDEGVFSFGSFLENLQQRKNSKKTVKKINTVKATPSEPKKSLQPALEEFLYLYSQSMQEGALKADPIILLRERFLERVDEYPFLDPFMATFEYTNGVFHFSDNVPEDDIARAIVICVWDVVWANRAERIFQKVIKNMSNKEAFDERGIPFIG